VTAETRRLYAFSRPYLRLPARFVVPRASAAAEPMHRAVADKRVGVLAGSAHERLLRDYFPAARAVTYSRAEWMLEDLPAGKLDAVFGDGMRLSFWLAGEESKGCCRFAGGPYLAPEYLGPGMAVAVRAGERTLTGAMNYALRDIQADGAFAELYLRYFPTAFF